jgi:hypothetical protein
MEYETLGGKCAGENGKGKALKSLTKESKTND